MGRIPIPDKARRAALVWQYTREGLSAVQIEMRTGMTTRTVYRYRERLRAAGDLPAAVVRDNKNGRLTGK